MPGVRPWYSAAPSRHGSRHGEDTLLGPRATPSCEPADMTLQGVPGGTAAWQFISTGLAALAQRDQELEAERRELQRMAGEREREQQAVRMQAAFMAGQLQQYSASRHVPAVAQSLAAARSRVLLGSVSGPTTPGDYGIASSGSAPTPLSHVLQRSHEDCCCRSSSVTVLAQASAQASRDQRHGLASQVAGLCSC